MEPATAGFGSVLGGLRGVWSMRCSWHADRGVRTSTGKCSARGKLSAGTAAQRMTAQGGAAAVLHGRHDLELAETEVSPLSIPPGRPVGAEDIRDPQA